MVALRDPSPPLFYPKTAHQDHLLLHRYCLLNERCEPAHGPTLRLRYDLLVNVLCRARPTVPKNSLRVLHIYAGLLKPRGAGAPQHLPVHPTNTELPGRRFDVPRQNRVVTHGCASPHRLEHQILWSVGLDDAVTSFGPPGSHHHLQRLSHHGGCLPDCLRRRRLCRGRRFRDQAQCDRHGARLFHLSRW